MKEGRQRGQPGERKASGRRRVPPDAYTIPVWPKHHEVNDGGIPSPGIITPVEDPDRSRKASPSLAVHLAEPLLTV